MKTRLRKRLVRLLLFTAVTAVLVVLESLFSVLLYRTPFFTGWILLGLVVFLAAYNLRKKMPFVVPLGSSAGWLQFHIYCGLLTGVLFLLHLHMRIPNGSFEVVLAAVYLGTFLSGVTGLILSRTIPRRLTSRGEEVIFERIPVFLKRVREEVEKLVFECVEKTGTTAVPDIYLNSLKPFFEAPRNSFWHLAHSSRPRKELLLAIENQQRFLTESEQEALDQIAHRVQLKDDLDYQYALQGTLKIWLFVHIPLTWGLLILSFFHLLAVYAYGGGN